MVCSFGRSTVNSGSIPTNHSSAYDTEEDGDGDCFGSKWRQ